MKLDRGWMWRALLLIFLTVAAAQDQQPEVEVSDIEEDLGLDEEELKVLMAGREDNEEEVTVMEKGHTDERDSASEKDGTDANVSFQVTNGSWVK